MGRIKYGEWGMAPASESVASGLWSGEGRRQVSASGPSRTGQLVVDVVGDDGVDLLPPQGSQYQALGNVEHQPTLHLEVTDSTFDQKSTKTGVSDFMTSWSKVLSVTSMGFAIW